MATPILKRLLLFPPNPIKPCPVYYFSSASPSPSDQAPLVSTIVSLLSHHRSKSRWTQLRSLLASSTNTLTPTHFSQIALHLKSNPHLALRFFYFTVHNSLCSHNLRSYSTIIHILSRARLKIQALSIIGTALVSPVSSDHSNSPVKFFERLVKTYRECDSAPFVFDLLIKSCLELKKIDGSIQIVRMLKSCGIKPQINTCNSLICWVSRCKGSYAGYGVFRELFGLRDAEIGTEAKRVVRLWPNVHSFNALMVGFYRDGEMEMVAEAWSEMERFGCVPNGYSFSVLMAMFCDEGKIKEAEESWEDMRVKGIKPHVAAYNTMIGGLCKNRKMEKAEELLREMESSGMEITYITYEHLITGYCKVGDFESVILVYKDMCRKDFWPEASTMDVLIGGLCEKRRISEAVEIMRIAMRNVTFCLSGKSYEFLIKGLSDDGKMEEALRLQAKMAGKGFEPNSKIYGAFIKGYMKLGNEEMAAKLKKEMSEAQRLQEEN